LDEHCHLLAGNTNLIELVELIGRASFAVTNDSGPMHMAVAVNTFVFALIGPTSPEKTGPYRNKDLIQSELSCSPCFKKRCPVINELDSGKCMYELTVEQVFNKIKKWYKT